jgi:hypothetical protein
LKEDGMKSGLALFALGVAGLAAVAATVAPPPTDPAGPAPASARPTVVVQEIKPPKPASQPGGMVSHSYGSGPVTYGKPMPQPPIVAIPRIPGPADMMVANDDRELRTLGSYASNEACDEALARVRRTISNAFCVSTTPPPPPPEYGFLFEVRLEDNELVALETHPSMAECQRVLAARPPKPGHQAGCSPKFH